MAITDITKDALIRAGASESQAETLLALIGSDAQQSWHAMRNILQPSDPFTLHHFIFTALANGNPAFAAWKPDEETIKATHVARWMQEVGADSVEAFHRWSVEHYEAYWTRMVDELQLPFHVKPTAMVGAGSTPEHPKWLDGAIFNIAEASLQAPADKVALCYQAENQAMQRMTYGELKVLSGRVAAGLRAMGITAGDAVAIDMVMTAESVAIYLGIIQLGAVVVSIADSFAPDEIRTRLELSEAKLIFTQDVLLRGGKTLPLYEKVCAATDCNAVVLAAAERLHEPLRPGDTEWSVFLPEKALEEFYGAGPEDVCNILFSSGTTGHPKVIPWLHTTPIKSAGDARLHHDIHETDRLCWPTNIGWMMGPWLIFAGLLNQASIALYYGPPLNDEFGKFIKDANVTMLGLVPSMVKYWRSSGCMDNVDWGGLRMFSSTGECSGPEDYLWLMSRVAGYRPVIEYCGGTETGGSYITSTLVQPNAPSCFSTKAFGLDMVILDETLKPCAYGKEGEVFFIPPSMGLSIKLLAGRDHHEVYYKDTPAGPDGQLLRRHGDELVPLEGGYYQALGRADDTMNLGGIKTSSAEIERVLNAEEGVVETAAIAATPVGGGPQELVIYAVLEDGCTLSAVELLKPLQVRIRENLNPLFKIEEVVVTNSLPRTASNKVMRRVLRDEYYEARHKAA